MLLFIYGPPAAGKYTIASIVAEQTPFNLFHNHHVVDLVHQFFDFGSEGFIALREKLWLDTFNTIAEHNLPVIFTFNPEATVRPPLIDEIFAMFPERYVIELACPDDVVESRLDSPSRSGFTKLTDVGIYRQARDNGGFDFDYQFEPDLVLNTDSMSAEASANHIINFLKDNQVQGTT